MKRVLDLFLSLFGIIALVPIFGIVVLAIAMDGSGKVLYFQQRVGKKGKLFWLVKFRSMKINSTGPGLTMGTNDSRITPVGRFIRKYKIDEFPQLWNVLRGDMSLVGPRPEIPEYVSLYTEEMRRVLDVRPGMTDPASLIGFNESESLEKAEDPETFYREILLPKKVTSQIAYLESASLRSDIRIIIRTLLRIFKH